MTKEAVTTPETGEVRNQAPRSRRMPGFRILVGGGSLVLLIAGLKEAQTLFVPILFAFFLAILGSAPLAWLTRRRVPTPIAVLLVAVGLIAAVVGVVTLLGSSIDDFRADSSHYQNRIYSLVGEFQGYLEEHNLEALSEQLFGKSDLVGPNSAGPSNPSMIQTLDSLSPQAILGAIRGAVGGLVGAVSSIFLVSVITIFMLVEAAEFREKLRAAVDGSLDMGRLAQVTGDVQRYLAIKTVTSTITGGLVFFFTMLLGLDFAHLWGLTAFILNYIPFVGSIIASVPAVLLALLDLGLGFGLTTALGYIVINVGVSNFLEPILMGRRLGLSPLVVFLSLVFWGWIWGPAGMLLSVPLTMIVKILLEHSNDLRWVAILMGGPPSKVKAVEEG